MKKTIASDMWQWAITLFEKNADVKLNILETFGFRNYIGDLPRRNIVLSGKAKLIETNIPDSYLEMFNSVNFSKIDKKQENTIKEYLIDFFKNKRK